MRLEPLLDPSLTLVLTGMKSRERVLERLASLGHERFPAVPEATLLAALQDREKKYPTGTPEGIAFPHALLPEIGRTLVIAALLRPGVRWSVQNHPQQDLVFGIIGNSEAPWEHVRLLARLARIARAPGALESLRASTDGQDYHRRLVEEDRRLG